MSPQRDGRTNEQTRKDEGAEGAEGADQEEVFTIILGMLESSGFRKYSTLLVIQLHSRRLCLCLCLCIRLCICICVPYSFLNSYYQKLSENVWVWGSGASRSWDVTIAGRTNKQPNKERQSQSANGPWKDEMSNFMYHFYKKCPMPSLNIYIVFVRSPKNIFSSPK